MDRGDKKGQPHETNQSAGQRAEDGVMSILIDDKALMAGLDKLFNDGGIIDQGTDEGLADGADILELVDKQTTAYLGMSGATRASSFAAPLDQRWAGKASAAYAEAQALLQDFTGHEGKPFLEDSGIVLGAGEKGIGLTTPTTYAADLEIDDAAAKAHLEPTLFSEALSVTAAIARASKAKLR